MRSEELIIIVGTASGWRRLLALCVRSSQSSAAGEPDLSAAAAAPREKSHEWPGIASFFNTLII